MDATLTVLQWLATLFIFAVGTAVLVVIGLDVHGTSTVRPANPGLVPGQA